MRGLQYDRNSGFLFTIQAPMRGHTFLTKWDARNNFEPINSIQVSDSICTSIDFSPYYNLICLADCKGSLIYVDAARDMSILKELALSEITIKSIAFKNGNLISGAADNALQLNYIVKSSIISFEFIIKLFIIIIFGYYLFSKIKQ